MLSHKDAVPFVDTRATTQCALYCQLLSTLKTAEHQKAEMCRGDMPRNFPHHFFENILSFSYPVVPLHVGQPSGVNTDRLLVVATATSISSSCSSSWACKAVIVQVCDAVHEALRFGPLQHVNVPAM
jgi:hypothetical protein